MSGANVVTLFGSGVREGGGGPSPRDLARFPLNDIGNAMRLILLAGGTVADEGDIDTTDCTLLFVLGGGWVGFNGVYWDRKSGEDLARKLAHQVAGKLPALFDVVKESSSIPPKEYFKFCNDSGSAGKTSAMLRQAQSYLTVEFDTFDHDPLALNTQDCTLKLAMVDGKFTVTPHKHEPSDRITRCCDVGYDPAATAPLFIKTVAESLQDEAERAYFKEVLGYSATGCAHEQVFMMAQGRGRDGKSTLLDACRDTLGTYGVAASPDTFLEGGMRSGSDAQPDLIALAGDTRLAVLSEPKRGAKLNEGLLKAWTSGSPISARDLHSKPINFRPKAKLIFECNAFPVARGDDDGIWRRVRPLLFRRQVPKDQVDRLLPDKLKEERAGILNWLIEGAGAWLTRGKLDPPLSLDQALEDYRRASSPFGDWLAERCLTGEEANGHRELVGDLYTSFKDWFEGQGFEKPMGAKAFGDALRDRQITVAGKNAKGLKYRGPIRLKTDAELALEAAEDAAAEALRNPSPAARQDSPSVGDTFVADDDWGPM